MLFVCAIVMFIFITQPLRLPTVLHNRLGTGLTSWTPKQPLSLFLFHSPHLPPPPPSLSLSPDSPNWHHAGLQKAILCQICRLHYKKYGLMKPTVDGKCGTQRQITSLLSLAYLQAYIYLLSSESRRIYIFTLLLDF